MNAVGIDVSKGRSTVAIIRPFGEIVASPFEVAHTDSELSKLAKMLKSLNGETKIVMKTQVVIICQSLMLYTMRGCMSA